MDTLSITRYLVENQQDNNILEFLRLIFLEHFYIMIVIRTVSLSPRLGRENETNLTNEIAGENYE